MSSPPANWLFRSPLYAGFLMLALVLGFNEVIVALIAWSRWLGILYLGPLVGLYWLMLGGIWFVCLSQPEGSFRWPLTILQHGVSLAIYVAIWDFVALGYGQLLDSIVPSFQFEANFATFRPLLLFFAIFVYTLVVLIFFLILEINHTNQAQEESLEQRVAYLKAEIKAMKAQFQPHFLFNSLTSISNLTVKDPRKARTLLIQLADFLRYAIAHNEQEQTPLEDEIENIENYLDLEKLRFGEKLQVEMQIAEGLDQVRIPPHALLTLVENAIKHGIANRLDGGNLIIKVAALNQMLDIMVTNPLAKNRKRAHGTRKGLNHLRALLRMHYDQDFFLQTRELEQIYEAKLQVPISRDHEVDS